MFAFESTLLSALVSALMSVLPAVFLLVLSRQLWTFRWNITRDKDCNLPLPEGSMGWPLVGETFHWLFQGSSFHISRRERHGNVFKTHLLGKPVIRVTGAENIRKILLGEHNLVCTQWPQSTRIILGPHTLVNSVGEHHKKKRKILAKVFCRGALETYLTRLQDVVKSEIAKWCSEAGSVDVYAAARALTFRIAVTVLLGLRLEEDHITYLSKIFDQLMNNLFSLPIDAPLSGLRKGIKAREILQEAMAKIIQEKLEKKHTEEYCDAFDYMLSSAKENDYDMTLQELKETAVELVFAAHSTTASASTSLILQLLKHPEVVQKARKELLTESLGGERHPTNDSECTQTTCEDGPSAPLSEVAPSSHEPEIDPEQCTYPGSSINKSNGVSSGHTVENNHTSNIQVPCLTLEKLTQLRYLDCVVKEVLRFLPPVSGGYRTVLQTFELNGYQVPKGWSVMYSIRDTHETAAAYQSPELFDPDRFNADRDESKSGRFNYVPFGGGVRRCIGRELAVIVLKTLAIELLGTAECRLATDTYPRMQTVPIVHPVNGLHVHFTCRNVRGSDSHNHTNYI
ncbi:cytochrome P450 26B1 [Engraulis encrasicolus]|uniref:cytochrome P450 26B1 n=1 Tax=Engraulis encrasicolus TaxID=184585 RepID=UPI002FD53E8C